MREYLVLQDDINIHKEMLVLIATFKSGQFSPASEQSVFDRTGLSEGFLARLEQQYRLWGQHKILKVRIKNRNYNTFVLIL
jgi:hypothetical protein